MVGILSLKRFGWTFCILLNRCAEEIGWACIVYFLRSLGPAVSRVSKIEAVRADSGALVGLGLTGLFLLSPGADLDLVLYLMAPFRATSVMLFAVPNSPLAQP